MGATVSPKIPTGTDGSGPHKTRAAASPVDGPEGAPPPPLPKDPTVLAEIRAGIERGLAQARAGIGSDLDEVLSEMDQLIAAHAHR